jgi:hypothetical protein
VGGLNFEVALVLRASYDRSIEDFTCSIGKHTEGECMTDVFGETDEATLEFMTFGRETWLFFELVIDFIVELEDHGNACIGCLPCETLERCSPIENLNGGNIHDVGDVFQAK